MLYQPPLPPLYSDTPPAELVGRIQAARERLGDRLVILGHHYQQDDVIQFADHTGDSLKLAQLGAEQQQAEFIVFCGVHFMAETADMLTPDSVQVVLPDLSAGCSMADMAEIDQLEEAWAYLEQHLPALPIPITYVNSTAAIKAFCGRHGGACCTSSNARAVLEWAFSQGRPVLFLPDQHLGRNVAYALGVPLDQMQLWDPLSPPDAGDAEAFARARVLLWQGHCSVHMGFTEQQCAALRRDEPDRRIIVHPECAWEVVQAADLAGSTEFIIKAISAAEPGSKWAVGTEVNLVNRLAAQHPEQDVRSLAPMQCLCSTMYRIDLSHLAWVLDELAAGRVVNRIRVDDETRAGALAALERMLANVPATPAAIK